MPGTVLSVTHIISFNAYSHPKREGTSFPISGDKKTKA